MPDLVENALTRDNPLCLPILGILKTRGELSEFELIKQLEAEGAQFPSDSGDSSLSLFRRHFVVMNALYQLQQVLLHEGWYLAISALKIQLLKSHPASGNGLALADADEKLAAYYLNWEHFDGMDSAGVDALLNSFWTRFVTEDKRIDALQVFDLPASASAADIKQRYRQLAAAHHPDRGGNPEAFVAIREAYEVLRSA